MVPDTNLEQSQCLYLRWGKIYILVDQYCYGLLSFSHQVHLKNDNYNTKFEANLNDTKLKQIKIQMADILFLYLIYHLKYNHW